MTFERPEYLTLLLILVPAGFTAGMVAYKLRRRILHALGPVELISSFSNLELGPGKGRTALYLISVSLLILSASGPRIDAPVQLKKGGVDILVGLDVSRSMAAEDFGLESRLQAAKNMIRHLMEKLNGNRIALITFAGTSFEQAPLTNDYKAVRFIIDEWVDINSVQEAGSDIIAGLETAVKIFNRSSRNALILLISDGGGAIEIGRAAAAYQSVRDRQMKVVVAGIGSRKGYLLKVSDRDDRRVLTALDERKLKEIAQACGGIYMDGNTDPVRITSDILNKKVIGDNAFQGQRSLYFIPLILAAVAFGAAFKL